MKAVKLLSVAFAMAFAMNANAQFVNSGGTSSSGPSDNSSYYAGYGKEKRFTNELGIFLGESWGLGYQLRREINPYLGIDIIGVSYLCSGWNSPDTGGYVNFRFLGARGYTPSWKWIRGYADLNLGYTLGYVSGQSYSYGGYKYDTDSSTTHHFGLDFGAGTQPYKNVAIGYHMLYVTSYEGLGGGTAHYCKISFPF